MSTAYDIENCCRCHHEHPCKIREDEQGAVVTLVYDCDECECKAEDWLHEPIDEEGNVI